MSAERKLQTADEALDGAQGEAETPLEPFALRQQVAEKLAAHRSRRQRTRAAEAEASGSPRGRKSGIAARVAERYAQSKSYHAFLAEEAERAVREAEETARQAEAAAEIASRNAEALAQVQYDLLSELDKFEEEISPSPATEEPGVEQAAAAAPQPSTPAPLSYTVRHAEDLRMAPAEAAAYRAHRQAARGAQGFEAGASSPDLDFSDLDFLDEEIAFRQSPVFDPVEPSVEIPGNLIEFPRQLVAPRRARPRLAEGPLREESGVHSEASQLRIFEVEAEQISPEPATETSAPEWGSILLDAHPRQRGQEHGSRAVDTPAAYANDRYATAPAYEPYLQQAQPSPHGAQHLERMPETEHLYAAPLHVAPIQLRMMSATVDLCIVLAASMVFAAAAVFTASTFEHGAVRMTTQVAALSSAGVIALLGLIYQILFFTFSDATLGMRYARLGLCTFSDDNPTRKAMRRRILALVLSSASLGLGVLWAVLDDERLGWHDRISRMYQRSY